MAYTVLTKKFAQSTFRLPLTQDGQSYLVCKPILGTKLNEVTRNCIAECGFDAQLAASRIIQAVLEECVIGWTGIADINGQDIPYSVEMLREICDADAEFAATQVDRIRRIAREARLEEEKN